jgi:hypothetical protein
VIGADVVGASVFAEARRHEPSHVVAADVRDRRRNGENAVVSVVGGISLPMTMAADLAQLRSRCENFLELIDDERGLRAAWLDLIAASRSKDMSYPTAATSRNLFFSILRRHGFNLGTFGLTYQISGILADHRTEIANAEFALSRRKPDFSPEDLRQDFLSGRPDEVRLQLAQDFLIAGDKTQDLTVWIEIIRASTSHTVAQVGQVTFYNHQWLSGRLQLSPEQRIILPAGLPEGFNEDGLASWLGEPKLNTVIARVDLKDQRLASAHKDAVDLVELVLRVSENLIDRPGWHLSGVYAIGNSDGHLRLRHGRPGTPGRNACASNGRRAMRAGLLVIQSQRSAAPRVPLRMPWICRTVDAANPRQVWALHLAALQSWPSVSDLCSTKGVPSQRTRQRRSSV